MSWDCFAEITIGGPLTEALAQELVTVLRRERLLRPDEEPAARLEGRLIRFAEVVPDGRFMALERFLRERGVAYDLWHEATADGDCELVSYRPASGLAIRPTDRRGGPVVRVSELKARLPDVLVRRVTGPEPDPLVTVDPAELARLKAPVSA